MTNVLLQSAMRVHVLNGLLLLVTDPESPTNLHVTTRTTNSVSLQWQYDNSRSLIEMWRVLYSEKENKGIAEITTEDIAKRELTIYNLTPGQTYNIELFAVTTGDIASQVPAEITVTISMYTSLYMWLVLGANTKVFLMFVADRKVSVNVHSVPSPYMIFMFYIHSDFNSPHLLLVLVNYDRLSLVDVYLVGLC